VLSQKVSAENERKISQGRYLRLPFEEREWIN